MPRTTRFPPAQRCQAKRTNGEPCTRYAVRGGQVCIMHGGRLPSVKLAAAEAVQEARGRLLGLVDPALDRLAELLDSEDETVRLRAVSTVLDRVLPRLGSSAVEVSLSAARDPDAQSMAELIRERLTRLAEALPGAGDTLPGETAALPGNPYVATVSREVTNSGGFNA